MYLAFSSVAVMAAKRSSPCDSVDMGPVHPDPGGHRLDREGAARDGEAFDLQARGGLERPHLALKRLEPVNVGDRKAHRLLRADRGGDGKAKGKGKQDGREERFHPGIGHWVRVTRC
jgi:hypothetical protein